MADMESPSSTGDSQQHPVVEFYLTTIWRYHPGAAKRIINELNLNYPDAQIIYDTEFHWFKVTCQRDSQQRFTELFSYIAADVEDDAFDQDYHNLLDAQGRLKVNFENDLIGYQPGDSSFDRDFFLKSLDDYKFPVKLAPFRYKEVWNKLEEDRGTIQNVVTPQQFKKLQTDTNVEMAFDGPGKLVYIASNNLESITKVKAKLDVLLEYSRLPGRGPEHILYTEGYIETGERARDQFLADIRYMANIHPRLPVSTLLDPVCVSNLENAYQKMYVQGASIRLCRWDNARGRHFSMLGPEVKGRGGQRYPLGNRPPIFLPIPTRTSGHGKLDLTINIPHSQLAVKDEKEARVAQWMEDWPTQSSMSVLDDAHESSADDYHTATPTAYPGSPAERIIEDICSVAKNSESAEGKKEQIMALANELVNRGFRNSSPSPRPKSAMRLSTSTVHPEESVSVTRIEPHPESARLTIPFENPVTETAILTDRPIPLRKPVAPQMPRKTSSDAAGKACVPVKNVWADDIQKSQPSVQHAQSTSVAQSVQPAVPAVTEEDYELQKKLMRERRELALKRRLEQEAREEVERKERMRLKLETLGPVPKSKNVKEAKDTAHKPEHLWSREASRGPKSLEPHPSPPAIITWSMAPLVPDRVTPPMTTGNDENKKDFKRYDELDAEAFNTMDQNTRSHQPSVSGSAYTRGTKLNLPKSAKPAEKPRSSKIDSFATEINEAIHRLLMTCPYQRGKVSVRADFGRIILGGLHPSTLAFNNSSTPSDGWKKEDLLKHLSSFASQREQIHFTKVLSTFGSDIEQMINTRDLFGYRLWQPIPGSSWVVYSFRSIYITGETETPVLINCRFWNEGKSYTYEITPFRSGNDGATPLYVHDIVRNWDLCIRMTSFDSQFLEALMGPTVRRFLDTVKIMNMDVDATDLKYTLSEPSVLMVHEVRVLTKWRYLNPTMKSELEITEVEPLSTKNVSEGKQREYRSHTPSKKELKFRANKGVAGRWYEASVVSTTMERLFKDNETLKLGEKTSWDLQTLRSYQGENVFGALYGPALQMLSQMDQIGGNDSNNMPEGPEWEVRARNEEVSVPGYTRSETITASRTPTQAAGSRPTATRPVNSAAPPPGPSTPTQAAGNRPTAARPVNSAAPPPGPSTPTNQRQPQQGQRRGRGRAHNSSETPPTPRWDTRRSGMDRNGKIFW